MNPQVLLVDDSESHRFLLRRVLQDAGPEWTTLEAEHADAALERLTEAAAADRETLVVTDHMMPGKNGTQLIEEARRRFPDAPFRYVLLTSLSSAADHQEGQASGADRVEDKPLELAKLRELVGELLAEWQPA